MKLFAALFIITFASGMLACGQKGPLVHPDRHPAGASVAEPAAASAAAPANEPASAVTAP